MQAVHSNSISSLTLNGFLQHDVPITLHRLTAPLGIVPPLITMPDRAPTLSLPLRTPVDLPPPGNASITLAIQAPAGEGATGQVYYVDVVDSTTEGYLPPLVVKIARPNRLGHITREAWFYDELAVLQGVCIPRCFGWFEAELPEWCLLPREALELDDDIKNDFISDDPIRVERWGRVIQRRSQLRTHVSLLLLERLGDKIPLSDPVPITTSDLCHLCIDHRDIRYPNILQAPTGPSALPGLPSPRTGRIYPWRLINLELCEKYKVQPSTMIRAGVSWIDVIFSELEWALKCKEDFGDDLRFHFVHIYP